MSKKSGRPPVMMPCGWCGESFSVSGMRQHVPWCPQRPIPKAQVTLEAAKDYCAGFNRAVKGGNEWTS